MRLDEKRWGHQDPTKEEQHEKRQLLTAPSFYTFQHFQRIFHRFNYHTKATFPLIEELLFCRSKRSGRWRLVSILDFQQDRLPPKPHQQVGYSLALADDSDSGAGLAKRSNYVSLVVVNPICSSHG